jgi:peptidylprolyl isomerase
MATDPKKNPAPDKSEREKMMRVLIPAGAIVLVVILVAVITSISSGGSHRMSDGSNGSADDPDLKEIASGVKYRDLKEGQGEACPEGAQVKVNYTGWLTDGTEFDSSKKKGSPAEFPLDGVIAGWTEGIPNMKVGGIRKLVIAPEKAYKNQKRGLITPGSTLIFEIELLGFTPKKDLTKLSDGTLPNAEDPGLKDIGDGLKIRDLKEGDGPPVPEGARVTVHYTGWLTNGHVFDSSYRENKPVTFSLGGVVDGWKKGIPGMKPGGIRKLVIPAALGYKDKPTGDIPPNSTLIFEVELIK